MPINVVLAQHGGPEVFRLERTALPPPGSGQIRLRQTAIGVNYHDVYVRSGLYRTLPLPGVPGIEAVGIIEAVGPEVTNVIVGDRVGYVTGNYGAYTSARNLPADLAIKLDDTLSDAQAAATLMKAFTVCALVRRAHRIEAHQAVLVHAAAGGVGQLLCNWASHLGATVIGTVGDERKREIARAAGASHVILYRDEDVVACVRELTGGEGVVAAYDSVGEDTFLKSLESLGYEGKLVNFGQASGPVSPFSPSLLASRSLSVVRPIVFHYMRSRSQIEAMAREVFTALASGVIRPITPLVMALDDVGEAHRILEARQSPGAIVLAPGDSAE